MKILFILFFFTQTLFAQTQTPNDDFFVEEIINDNLVLIKPTKNNTHRVSDQIRVGSSFAIFAKDTSEEVVGFANVINKGKDGGWVAKIHLENLNKILRQGSYARLVNFNKKLDEFPGSYNLLRNSDSKAQARYQNLTYLGYWGGQTSAPLRKNEFLAGPTMFAYGAHPKLTLMTTPLLNFIQILNIGVKYQWVEDEGYSFSTAINYHDYVHKKEKPTDFHLMLDMFGNAKIMSYSRLSFLGQRPVSNSYITSNEYDSSYTAELQNIYGIMLRNWDRLLIGPKYNFEDKLLGGHISYVLIGKHGQLLAGIQSNNFARISFGTKEIIPIFDFYWRF